MDYGYRSYIADCAYMFTKSQAENFGGMMMNEKWADIYRPQEIRDAEAIKNDICNKINRMRSE